MIATLLLLACGSPQPPEAARTASGLLVTGEAITRVTLLDPDGVATQTRRSPAPVDVVGLDLTWLRTGTWTALVVDRTGEHRLPVTIDLPDGPVIVEVEAPAGQARRPVSDGDTISLPLIDGAPAQVAVIVTARVGGSISVAFGDSAAQTWQASPGQRRSAVSTVSDDVPVAVATTAGPLTFTVDVDPLPLAQARAALEIVDVAFPAMADGSIDPTRPTDRITLPSRWWQASARALGLGFRPRDGFAPWAWQGVTLANRGDSDINLVLTSRVVGEDGDPDPIFRPRMREGDDGSGVVKVLLRVPAHSEVAGALPVYVDESALSAADAANRAWTRELTVSPLGSSAPLLAWSGPLYASRGSTAASLGLVAAIGAALLGAGLLARRGPRWLSTSATTELMTIALFGSLTFLVSALGQLLTSAVAVLLGPFATLLTGLVDDAFRFTLLATLVTLIPRPGTASLAAITGWLLSGVALGTFAPTDLLFVCGRVFWLESALWLAGITRTPGWQDEPPLRRWLRLSAGFGSASLASAATGLVLQVVLFRLYLADWYVGLVLAVPSFAYVVLACAIAVPFAASLRGIQR